MSRSLTETFWNELRDAREHVREIVHIRVTLDAIQGSIASVPLTPERARALGRLIALPDGAVLADPSWYERRREIVIHPEDWSAVLKDPELIQHVGHDFGVKYPVRRVFDIPVSE